MLQNEYFLAKIGADTAENEQHFAEILPIGRCVADDPEGRGVVGWWEFIDVWRDTKVVRYRCCRRYVQPSKRLGVPSRKAVSLGTKTHVQVI